MRIPTNEISSVMPDVSQLKYKMKCKAQADILILGVCTTDTMNSCNILYTKT